MGKAKALVAWCHKHNDGQLVTPRLSRLSPDPAGHDRHYNFLHWQRQARKCKGRQASYPQVWAIISEAFPGWSETGDSASGRAGQWKGEGCMCRVRRHMAEAASLLAAVQRTPRPAGMACA